jgi:hypothetical protein
LANLGHIEFLSQLLAIGPNFICRLLLYFQLLSLRADCGPNQSKPAVFLNSMKKTNETAAVSGTRLPRSVKLEFEKALECSLGLDTPSTFFRLCALAFLHHYHEKRKIKWPPVFEVSADPLEITDRDTFYKTKSVQSKR